MEKTSVNITTTGEGSTTRVVGGPAQGLGQVPETLSDFERQIRTADQLLEQIARLRRLTAQWAAALPDRVAEASWGTTAVTEAVRRTAESDPATPGMVDALESLKAACDQASAVGAEARAAAAHGDASTLQS